MSKPHTAFVSGAGQNIGRAIALRLAAAGCRVVVNGSRDQQAIDRVADEITQAGGEALALKGDVGRPADIAAMAEAALARFGTVDIVVNNAAIRPATPFLEMSDEECRRVLDIDLMSAIWTARAFLPGMVGNGWGRIVNLTGMNAIHGYAGRAPVSVAKHGLWGLSKSLAKEFGPQGVTVNAISPGPIAADDPDSAVGRHASEQLARIPVGRLGRPDDIAAMVALLASEDGGFVNGQMIAVNGGAQT